VSVTERGDLLARAERVLDALPGGVTADVRCLREEWGTMRFANGEIHQPHEERDGLVSLRVRREGRTGIATTTDFSRDGLARLARSALAIARFAPSDPTLPPFPANGGPVPAISYSAATVRMPPEAQARLAERALASARDVHPDARISGAVHVGGENLAIANTSGLRRFGQRSVAEASVLVELPAGDPPASGWSDAAHWDATQLNTARLGREAAETVARSPPGAVKPGKYRVLLSGTATAELLSYLGFLGFNGRGDEEGWGCLRTKRGRRIAPEFIHLIDEGPSAETLPQAIDFEGVTKRRTALIDHGVAGSPVTDLRLAKKLGTDPTGHGPPPESPWGSFGPIPTQQILRPGSASDEDLRDEVRDGLLVTRFHYIRVVHPGRGLLTGMTRDGTYRIRHGEIAEPVRNLRFTESVLTPLRTALAVGKASRRYADERGYASVRSPSLAAGEFRFTSATLF
jgi:PmbA protein